MILEAATKTIIIIIIDHYQNIIMTVNNISCSTLMSSLQTLILYEGQTCIASQRYQRSVLIQVGILRSPANAFKAITLIIFLQLWHQSAFYLA